MNFGTELIAAGASWTFDCKANAATALPGGARPEPGPSPSVPLKDSACFCAPVLSRLPPLCAIATFIEIHAHA